MLVRTMVLLCATFAVLPMAPAQGAPPRVRVLFLGDDGHHRPKTRHSESKDSFSALGIDLTYTSDPERLESEKLFDFDAVLVYANLDSLATAAEDALLRFIRSGRGFVPLHCASACCPNSERWTALVGGRFLSHGTGVLRPMVADPSHPTMRGFMPFATFDESYVHERLSLDRHILQWRVESEHREPWTWTRLEGHGRVFYTASGHDERTWSHPGFVDLVARGTRWAAGDRFLPQLAPLPTLTYTEAEVPTYAREGERRATAGKPKGRLQAPLTPKESMLLAAVPAGFELQCFASEPEITNPTAMAFDERGRLWITETVDYPNSLTAQGQGHDRIKICEDTDGDGRADRFTIFAEGLSIPTSLAFARGGVLVTAQPETLFFADTDGDDRADVRQVLFFGWGRGDTHAGPSNLRFGLDGWIWCTVGYSGFRGRVGDIEHEFGSGIVRFRSDGAALELLTSTSNNTWGLGISEDGEIFYSTANNDVFNYLAIPNRVFEAVPGWHGQSSAFIANFRDMHPATDDVRQVDWHGRYTAAAGAALYTARSFPMAWWNRIAFVCEPTGHLIGQAVLERNGSGFTARDGFNFFESRDAWTAPVAAEVGPDGALWFIDWYSPIVQHNPTPHGFETGRGGAYETALRDLDRARIYRIVSRGAPRLESPDLSTPDRIVATLAHPNMLWRLHAQRLILESGEAAYLPLLLDRLLKWTEARETDSTALVAVIATLGSLGNPALPKEEIESAILARFKDSRADVRAMAVRVAARSARGRAALLDAALHDDPDLLVRREAFLALASMPAEVRAGRLAWAALSKLENVQDRWIPAAVTAAGARHGEGFLAAALSEPTSTAIVPAEGPNLLPNPSFEDVMSDGDSRAPPWRVRTYGGIATHRRATGGRSGAWCLEISSVRGSDTSFYADVQVDPNATYRLDAWIRTSSVLARPGAFGALLNVHGRSQEEGATTVVTGTEDWRRVDLVFTTREDENSVSINCLFGGWGFSTGTAWFDDLSLVKIGDSNGSDGQARTLAQAVRAVTRSSASRGRREELPGLLAAIEGGARGFRASILSGLAAGWPQTAGEKLDDEIPSLLKTLAARLPADELDDLVVLARKLGAEDSVAEAAGKAATAARAQLYDRAAGADERLRAAERWMRLEDNDRTHAQIIALIDPAAEPEFGERLIQILGQSRAASLGSRLLPRMVDFTPALRRAMVSTLLWRPAWQHALIEDLKSRKIRRSELSAEQWEKLLLSATPEVVSELRRVEAGATDGDRQKVFERLLPSVDKDGDPERGRQVFRTLCASCHRKDDYGFAVAPALDGVGRRSKQDLLLEIVDPNRSVEATYQLWLLFTKEGESFSGRMVSETRTSIELQDSGDVRHIVPRAEIESMRATNRSLMPEGLIDSLSGADLAALLTYLARSG